MTATLTDNEARALREIRIRNHARYREQLLGGAEPAWDYCVLTAGSARQARIYQAEIDRRLCAGWLPEGTAYFVVADLDDRRIGSGGAAAYALREVFGHWSGMPQKAATSPRTLIINGGGDSRRIPHLSVLGKVFADLPFASAPGSPPRTLFDESMAAVCGLHLAAGSAVLLSSDVLLVFAPEQFTPQEGVTGLAWPGPASIAGHHGVYLCRARSGPVEGFLQKPSHDELMANDALSDGMALVDTGLLCFDAAASRQLASLAGATWDDTGGLKLVPGVLEQPGAEELSIDLYDGISRALARVMGQDGGVSPMAPASAPLLSECFATTGFTVVVPDPCFFYHLGSTAQWRDFLTSPDLGPALFGDRQCSDDTNAQPDAPLVCTNASICDDLRAAGLAVVEYTHVGSCELGAGAVVSNVELAGDLRVPANLVLCQFPIGGGAPSTWRSVTLLYGVADDPKARPDSRSATFCNGSILDWMAARGVTPDDIWPTAIPVEDRCLWNARLYVPGAPGVSLRWACWLACETVIQEDVSEWLRLPRVCLSDAVRLADSDAMLDYRQRLRGLALGHEIVAGAEGDEWSAAYSRRISTAREFANAANVVVTHLSREQGFRGRSRLYQVLADITGDQHLQQTLTTEARSHPCELPACLTQLSSELMGRAAHTHFELSNWLEDLAFAEVRAAVGAGLDGMTICRGNGLLGVASVVTVKAPARVDFGGGWSDTPPFSIEHGGAVLNAALQLDGVHPIAIRGEITSEPQIELVSGDGDAREVITDAMSFTQYNQPGDPLSLHKAAMVLSGLSGPGPGADLRGFLANMGGGVRLRTDVSLPQGSGLGTSSIAAMAMLRCIDLLQGADASADSLTSRVLYLEQMLTTGGGWQDQLGGATPGIKLIKTEAGLSQKPTVRHIHLSPDVLAELERRLLVCYVGERRMAKHILRAIVRRYLSRVPGVVDTLCATRDTAYLMETALQQGDVDEFGRLVGRTWVLNKQLDEHATTEHVEGLLAAADGLLCGAKLAGAGGGGFLVMIARDESTAAEAKRRLTPLLAPRGGRFYEARIATQGMTVERARP